MTALHRNAQQIQELLASLGSEEQVVQLADSTRSAAEAAAVLGVDPAQIAKSIVFLADPGTPDERPVLVIASGRNRICKKKLRAALGCKVRQADAQAVKAYTGFPIGGVPPLGHSTEPVTLIDPTLEQYEELWAAAGTPFSVYRTGFEQLVRWTGGRVVDVEQATPEA